MKNNSTKRGFTLTELIIILAVIGILATIIVASFINITDRAKAKTDEQTVASLNASLDSAKAVKKDLSDIKKVRDHLLASGYSQETLKNPETIGDNDNDKFCFVWDESEEAVLMIKLLDNSVIYPEEYKDDTTNTGDWYFLAPDGTEPADDPALSASENYEAKLAFYSFPSAERIAAEYYSERIEAMSAADKEKSYIFIAKIKMEYTYDGVTYPIVENDSERVQTVYAIYDGGAVGTSTNPLGQFTVIKTARGNLYNTTQASTQGWILKVLNTGASDYNTITGLYGNDYVKDTTTSVGSTFYTFTKLDDGISTTGNMLQDKTW